MKKYNTEYFINKFESIPNELWTTGRLQKNGASCALGHCGVEDLDDLNAEAVALADQLKPIFVAVYEDTPNFSFSSVTGINDWADSFSSLGDTPKERIINALVLAHTGIYKEAV